MAYGVLEKLYKDWDFGNETMKVVSGFGKVSKVGLFGEGGSEWNKGMFEWWRLIQQPVVKKSIIDY